MASVVITLFVTERANGSGIPLYLCSGSQPVEKMEKRKFNVLFLFSFRDESDAYTNEISYCSARFSMS